MERFFIVADVISVSTSSRADQDSAVIISERFSRSSCVLHWFAWSQHAAIAAASLASHTEPSIALTAGKAVLMLGARGYSNAHPVERYYRDIKGLEIYEGTSHIQRLIIARDIIGKGS